jgi:transposase InsO family protein
MCCMSLCKSNYKDSNKHKFTPINQTRPSKNRQPHTRCLYFGEHFFSPVQGRLPHTYGCEKHGYTCGSLFIDHTSGKIFNFPQFSTNTTETLTSVAHLESQAHKAGFKNKKYHSDNVIFSSAAFKAHCKQLGQEYSFSGVGAHHQNEVTERNIKTIAQWACANMLHLATHWPQQACSKFWPQAIDYLGLQ